MVVLHRFYCIRDNLMQGLWLCPIFTKMIKKYASFSLRLQNNQTNTSFFLSWLYKECCIYVLHAFFTWPRFHALCFFRRQPLTNERQLMTEGAFHQSLHQYSCKMNEKHDSNMGLVARKPVFRGLRTTQLCLFRCRKTARDRRGYPSICPPEFL